MSAMDINLNHRATGKSWVAKKREVFAFVQSLKDEMRKVSWPAKEELGKSTQWVVMTTFFFGVAIYLVDLLIKGGLDGIANMFRYIFG